MNDLGGQLRERIEAAFRARTPLVIRGGGTKDFYGRTVRGEPLEAGGHRGVVDLDAREQVVTVRGGTPLAELEEMISAQRLMLGCEPPHFAPGATVGGMVACGLAGPRRPYGGAVRDFILGARVVNGCGETLHFGGRVIKNVAGYDLARLMAGALGTLGLLLEVTLRLVPKSEREVTLMRECTEADAIAQMQAWAVQPLPVSGTCHVDGRLYVRLSGSEAAVAAATRRVGGDPLAEGGRFWSDLRDHRLPFFGEGKLWRLSVPADTPPLNAGPCVIDWGGAQRWVTEPRVKNNLDDLAKAPSTPRKEEKELPGFAWRAWRLGESPDLSLSPRQRRPGEAAADAHSPGHLHPLHALAARLGGHAALFRGGEAGAARFQPQAAALAALHRRLKESFDPAGILNPGRLYAGL